MNLPVINNQLKTAKEFFGSIPWLLARHAFAVLLILVLADLAIGQWAFYYYATVPLGFEPDTTSLVTTFKQQEYDQLLLTQAKRQAKLANDLQYQNPF